MVRKYIFGMKLYTPRSLADKDITNYKPLKIYCFKTDLIASTCLTLEYLSMHL